jgi:hypothetical protein
MIHIPNTVVAFDCYVWMLNYFTLMGDCQPNRDNEVHLEPIEKKEIFKEYVEYSGSNDIVCYASFTNFNNIWINCFPNVSIRQFKVVSGKCRTCSNLSDARKKASDLVTREYVKRLHLFHRSAYMGERLQYATRRNKAISNGQNYLSMISDGMAQGHCELPYLQNMNTFSKKLGQHLQGVLLHGRGMLVFRTFHNLKLGANAQIHCFLMTLEIVSEREST